MKILLRSFKTLLVAFLLQSELPAIAASAGGKTGLLTEPPEDQTEDLAKTDRVDSKKLEWNVKNLLEDYRGNGSQNAKWDVPAERALTAYASNRSGVVVVKQDEMNAFCQEALKAGCKDPMIKYLLIRAIAPQAGKANMQQAKQYSEAAKELEASKYSGIRKFYGFARAADAMFSGGGTNRETRMLANTYRRNATSSLESALKDDTIPVTEAYDACRDLLNLTYRFKQEYHYAFHRLEPILLAKWPDESSIQLIRGHFYIEYAWAARGNGLADTVTDEGWKLMAERLETAAQALEKAWKLNPKDERIPTEMITVEMGQGKGRERMELWFGRAMQLRTNNYRACWKKAYYLEPKWYGSPEELLKFGRECVASKNWGGKVPLILVDAHNMLVTYLPREKRADYWKQPEVWNDLKAGYEKYLKSTPDGKAQRERYIRHAYENAKWAELNTQLKLLSEPNYASFGGKAKI